VDPTEDSAGANAVADHAYWLSGLRARDAKAAERARIDARSEAFGAGDAPVGDVEEGAGAVQGGARGPMGYRRRSQEWGPAPARPKRDTLVVEAKNLAAATVDTRRARLSCAPLLDVKSDGPLDLRLDCPAEPAAAPSRAGARARKRCSRTLRLKLPRVKGRRVVSVLVTRRGRRVKSMRGRNLRSVTVRRPTTRAFALRIRVRTSGRSARRVTVLRRYAACASTRRS
jgi:hypothetical protein